MENSFNLKKFLAEGRLLKEDTTPMKLKTQNFINQNFKDFSQLGDSEVSQFELNQVPSDVVNFLKTVERFDYKGIAIYYVEDKNQIWVENMDAPFDEGLNEGEESDILSFLKLHKPELIQALAKRFKWDEDDIEDQSENEIEIGGDSEGNPDPEIAGLGDAGMDFSFNKNKVKDDYGDASEFTIEVGGKTLYGIAYNF